VRVSGVGALQIDISDRSISDTGDANPTGWSEKQSTRVCLQETKDSKSEESTPAMGYLVRVVQLEAGGVVVFSLEEGKLVSRYYRGQRGERK